MRLKVVGAALAAASLLVMSGCGRAAPDSYQSGPRDLVLQLVEIPAVVDPGEPAALVPTFSLYGDGRVLISSPNDQQGALPRVRSLQLSEERVQQLVSNALDAGVQDNREENIEIDPDAPTVVLTLTAEERFGWSELGPNVGGRLGQLRDSLLAYAERKDAQPYEHDAIAVLATPTDPEAGAEEWPLAELRPSAERRIGDSHCTTYRRTNVEDVTATARGADPDAVWSSGTDVFDVRFRPMLPHETDCDSLATDHRTQAEQQN